MRGGSDKLCCFIVTSDSIGKIWRCRLFSAEHFTGKRLFFRWKETNHQKINALLQDRCIYEAHSLLWQIKWILILLVFIFQLPSTFRCFFFFGKTYTKASPPKPKPGHASVWAFSNAWELSKSSRKPTKGVGSSCKPKKIDRCPKKLSPPKKLACPLKMKQLLFWGHVTISGGLKTRNAEVCPSKNAFCREACEVNVVCGWNVPGCAFDGYTAYGDSAGNGRFRRWPTQNLRRGDLLEGMVEEMDRDGYGYKEK